MQKVGLISLGCAKNLVDSEIILGMFSASGFTIVNTPEEADIIVVNTCGFITPSKEESIDTILEMAAHKKKLIVTGCLAERYYESLKSALPEVDLLVKISDYPNLNVMVERLLDDKVKLVAIEPFRRVLATSPFSAYLRISEGCDNKCTYCAIPLIRGSFRSRPYDDLMREATALARNGVKELIVISQDTTRYGTDLREGKDIVSLLDGLLQIEELASIRLLYLYPDEISDELIAIIRDHPRIAPYFDIPIQHACDDVLARMHRRSRKAGLVRLINKIRAEIPHAIIRSTYIVGFPGESESDFEELVAFTEEMAFNHLGVFAYSREEDTPAHNYPDQVPDEIKQQRLERIMEVQKKISYRNNRGLVGRIMDGIVTSYDEKAKIYAVRTYFNAPDDIDGSITFASEKRIPLGSDVRVRIIAPFVYDLCAELID